MRAITVALSNGKKFYHRGGIHTPPTALHCAAPSPAISGLRTGGARVLLAAVVPLPTERAPIIWRAGRAKTALADLFLVLSIRSVLNCLAGGARKNMTGGCPMPHIIIGLPPVIRHNLFAIFAASLIHNGLCRHICGNRLLLRLMRPHRCLLRHLMLLLRLIRLLHMLRQLHQHCRLLRDQRL